MAKATMTSEIVAVVSAKPVENPSLMPIFRMRFLSISMYFSIITR